MKHNAFPVNPVRLAAFLMLLSLALVASTVIFAHAAPTGKTPTVFINGSGRIELTWKSGKTETYSVNAYTSLGGLISARLFPSRGWHVQALMGDGNAIDFVDKDGYVLIDLSRSAPKRSVSVTFVENGGVDDVDPSHKVAYPDPDVGVTFTEVTGVGYVYANTIGLRQSNQIGESWDIRTDGYWFVGDVEVELVLRFEDIPVGINPNDLKLCKTEVVVGDVNLDGVVDGTDVSIIANHNPSKLGELNYDPRCDIAAPKGIIDDQDVTTASHNIGLASVWIELETTVVIDSDNALIYYRATTTGLYLPIDPIFGVH